MTPKQSLEAEAKEKALEKYPDGRIRRYANELGYIAGANRSPINTEGLKSEFLKWAYRKSNNPVSLDEDTFKWFEPHLRSNVETTTEGWISVADRLPTENKGFLCSNSFGYHIRLPFDIENSKRDFTHWMPLPNPPKPQTKQLE